MDGYNWELLSNTSVPDVAYCGNTCVISRSWVSDSKELGQTKDSWIPQAPRGRSGDKALPMLQNNLRSLNEDNQNAGTKNPIIQPKGVLTK